MEQQDTTTEKVIVDIGIFDRELLEKVCRQIKQKKEQQKESGSA